MRTLNAILIAIVVAGAVLAIYALSALTHPAPPVTFVSITGKRITPADLRGKVTLVEFWSTDCVICLREMPEVVDLYNAYRARGLQTIAVAMRYDPPSYVLRYARDEALPFDVALDPMGALAKAFDDVNGTPTRILIDRNGRIVARVVGATDFNGLRRQVEAALKERAPATAS
jgi:peroxiredoxin